jgi:hypothetical protein
VPQEERRPGAAGGTTTGSRRKKAMRYDGQAAFMASDDHEAMRRCSGQPSSEPVKPLQRVSHRSLTDRGWACVGLASSES